MSFDPNNPYALSPAWEEDRVQHELFIQDDQLAGDDVRWRVIWDRLLVFAIFIISVVGAGLGVSWIESIVGSGIAISIAGVLLLIRELWCRQKGRPKWSTGLVLAAGGPVFAAGVWLTIFVSRWGPRAAADNGVGGIVAVFGTCSAVLAVVAFFSVPRCKRRSKR